MVKVAVMGAGSWGTTLAKVFADAGAVFVQQVKGEAAPETGHGVQAFQRQGGKDAAEEED